MGEYSAGLRVKRINLKGLFMKTLQITQFSRDQILKFRNFDILSMMEELEIQNITLELLPHGKCRVFGCKNIHHLDWNNNH